MEILHLTLKKKWFDMILSGDKKEEYREIKRYWQKRLFSKIFTHIRFKNGYRAQDPKFIIKLKGIAVGIGKSEWGAPENEQVFILECGEIIERKGC